MLSPADRLIAAVAPAGPPPEETVRSGIKALKKHGFEVQVMPHVMSGGKLPFLAADDKERLTDLTSAWLDEKISLLWCIRGGYGSARLLPLIDWEKLAVRDVGVAGFSDITSLHWAMIARNTGTALTVPTFAYLAAADKFTWFHLLAALNNDARSFSLPALRPGTAEGLPLAGNLTVAAALCGTPYMPDTAGRVIILEDVGETSTYRIDRSLNQLLLAGVFDRCAGVVFGRFTDCGDQAAVMAVLSDFTIRISVPVFYDMPFGHELPFVSFSSRAKVKFRTKTSEV